MTRTAFKAVRLSGNTGSGGFDSHPLPPQLETASVNSRKDGLRDQDLASGNVRKETIVSLGVAEMYVVCPQLRHEYGTLQAPALPLSTRSVVITLVYLPWHSGHSHG